MRTTCVATFLALGLILGQTALMPTGARGQSHGVKPDGEIGNNLARIERLAKEARYKTDYVGRPDTITSIWEARIGGDELYYLGGHHLQFGFAISDIRPAISKAVKDAHSGNSEAFSEQVSMIASLKDAALSNLERYADPHSPYSPKVRHLALQIAKAIVAIRCRFNGKIYSVNTATNYAHPIDVASHFEKTFVPWIRMDAAARRAKAHRGKTRSKHATNTKADEPESILDFIFKEHKVEKKNIHTRAKAPQSHRTASRPSKADVTNQYRQDTDFSSGD